MFIDFELLGLLCLLEGVFGFLALLEGSLNHGVPHARRSERSADDGKRFYSDGRFIVEVKRSKGRWFGGECARDWSALEVGG